MSPEQSTQNRGVRAGHSLGGRYTLVSRIAKGGMGEVWRVRDRRTGMLVAAKVLRPELRGETISLSRLRLEATNTLRAQHPNIAAVLDSGEDDGQGWIVMELVEGRPLTEYVGDGKRLTAEQLIPILTQTAYALDSSAHAGVVHRDIKPANIMVRPDGIVKLTDFGISFAQGQANLTAVGMVMGTAQYLAPEQALGKDPTVLGDLYSLGVIAYEGLAGKRPFTGKSAVDIAMAHVKEEVPALPDDVPEPLQQVVYDLLAKDPGDRPQTGTALVRMLTRVAGELGTTTAPKPLPAPIQPVAEVKVPRTPRSPEASKPAPRTPTDPGTTPPARSTNQAPSTRDAEPGDSDLGVADEATVARPESARPELPKRSALRATAEKPDPTLDQAAHPQAAPPEEAATSPAPWAERIVPEPASPADRAAESEAVTGPESVFQWRPMSATLGPERSTPPPPSTAKVPPPPAPRASASAPGGDSSSAHSGNVGMWLVGALVILTVILIVIAMIRDRGSADAAFDHSSQVAMSQTEVQTWLTPMPDC